VVREHSRDRSPVPGPRAVWAVAASSALGIAVTFWLAVQPGAAAAQAAVVRWVNDPPEPFGAVLALTNAWFRPLPLALVALALTTWILATTRGGSRGEVMRSAVLAVAVAELFAQVLKRLADQPRPTASIPGLDVHGYPKDPYGNSYPSAHTAVTVGLVAALWPWLTRSQRVVGVAVATLVALNRVYIGAHWPVDVLGGAAIGLFSGSVCWLVASRWPLPRDRHIWAGPSRL